MLFDGHSMRTFTEVDDGFSLTSEMTRFLGVDEDSGEGNGVGTCTF